MRRYVWIVIDRGRGRGRLTKREREKEREREIGAETEEERLKDRKKRKKTKGKIKEGGKSAFMSAISAFLLKIISNMEIFQLLRMDEND